MEKDDLKEALIALLPGGIATILVITAMILAADLAGEKEIIFPEIAALSAGCFLAPQLPWRTNYRRLLFFIELCAFLGVGIVLFIPAPLTVQVILAFMIGQLVYLFSGTSLAPMISAIVLPVLLQTRTPVYLIAAFCLTLLMVLLRTFLERAGVKEPDTRYFHPVPKPDWHKMNQFVFRSIYVAALASICLPLGARFLIAPPLLVAFTEITDNNHPAYRRKYQMIALVTLCALSGALCRYGLVMQLGLAPALAAVCISLLIILWMFLFHFYFPPAGAMAVLAMLIPDTAVLLYPLYACAGISLLTLGAVIFTWLNKHLHWN